MINEANVDEFINFLESRSKEQFDNLGIEQLNSFLDRPPFLKADYCQDMVDVFCESYSKTRPIPLDAIPYKSGIYIFAACMEDGEPEEILYIGKAKKLRGRLLSYSREPNFSLKTKPILKYMFDGDVPEEIHIAFNIYAFLSENPEGLERKLIEHYKPRFNVVHAR